MKGVRVLSFLRSSSIGIILLVFGFILFGAIGFMIIEDLHFVDALYMTVIILSTVGLTEVHEFSQAGRAFTVFLILSGVGLFFYSITQLAIDLLSGNFIKRYNTTRMEKQLESLKDHVVVCGYGRNGKQAVDTLRRFGNSIIVIEKSSEIVERYYADSKVIFLEGNATEDEVLGKAKIDTAKALISALPSDADNLYTVLTARQLSQNLKIISRASQINSMKKLKIAGANNVVMPDKIGGEHMASIVANPDLIEFIESLSVREDDAVNLIEVSSDDIDFEDKKLTIGEIDIKPRTGCTVIGFKNAMGQYIINPEDTIVLEDNSFLIVLGRPSQIARLKKSYNLED